MAKIETVSCDICKKEIPQSVAMSAEGKEYLHHFCSPDCREHYFEQNPAADPDKSEKAEE